MSTNQHSSLLYDDCKTCLQKNHRLTCESCVRMRKGLPSLTPTERTWALFQTPSENEPLRVGDSLFFCRLLKAGRNSVVIQVEKVWPNQFWKFILYRDRETRGLGVIKEYNENGDHFTIYNRYFYAEIAKDFFSKLVVEAEEQLEKAKKRKRSRRG